MLKNTSLRKHLLLVLFSSIFWLGLHQNSLAKEPYKTTKLDNGMELLTLESHKVPLVTVVLAIKAGAMTETPESNGLTHVWEHMFFKGNKRLSTQEVFKKRVRELGITYNGDTSAEMVRYYFTLPSAFLENGLEFMFDAISSPLLEKSEIEKERTVILDEYDRTASSPQFDLWNLNRALFFGKYVYLRDPLGQKKMISAATPEKLLEMKDRVFVPQNACLMVGGDFDATKIEGQVKKYFLKWKTPKNWKQPLHPKLTPLEKTTEYVITNEKAKNALIVIVFNAPIAIQNPAASYGADMLVSLIGQHSGKFYRKFVESGLTVEADLSFLTQSKTGQMSLYAITKPEKAAEVKQMLLDEVKEWTRPDYFNETQLENIKRSVLINRKRELNVASDYLKTLAFWWTITGLGYYETYLDKIRATSLIDVRDFVQNWLIDKPYVSSILLSPKDAKEVGLEDTSKPLVEKYLVPYYEGKIIE